MDMAPPQAPPAMTQTTHQEATAAIERMVAAQAWMTAQEDLLPALPQGPAARSRHGLLNAMAAYWEEAIEVAPGEARVGRWMAFGRHMASLMRAEATLRERDGTLSARAKDVVSRFFSVEAPAPGMETHTRAAELVFGDVAYAGALVLVDDDAPDLALLYFPDRGWEEYADLPSLRRVTEERLRQALARDETLPGIAPGDLTSVLDAPFVDTREIHGPVLPVLVGRVMALQREHIRAAWDALPAAGDAHAVDRYLHESVAPFLRFHHAADVYRTLVARNLRLAEAITHKRLADVPAEVANAWRSAGHAYAATLQVNEREREGHAATSIMGFEEFVDHTLAAAFRTRGIAVTPGEVTVDVHDFTAAYFYNPGGSVSSGALGAARERRTMRQMTLANAGVVDTDILIARRKNGELIADLPSALIRRIVRECDVATAYSAYLTVQLKTSPDAALHLRLARDAHRARMRLEAEDARLGYFLADEPRSFADDHSFRGYQWVRSLLDAESTRTMRKVEGHELVVYQLTYKGAPMRDVIVIGARSAESVSSLVLYTPDAPDGVSFREFGSRADAERLFLRQPRFETYLVDRLPAEFAEQKGGGRRFRMDREERRFRWIFNIGDANNDSRTEAFETRRIDGDVFATLHETDLSHLVRNVHAVARTTAHADADNFVPGVTPGDLGRGIAHLLGRPFQASWRAYDHMRDGDHAQAMVAVADAWVSSLDFAAIGTLKPMLQTTIMARAAGPGAGRKLVPTPLKLRDPATVFDDRFVAGGVSIRNATSVRDGVYRVGDRYYIENHGKVYGVRRDGQNWRLHATESATWAPHVGREADGTWRYLGLKGGTDPHGRLRRHGGENAALHALTPYQQEVFEQALLARVSVEEAQLIADRISLRRINSLTTPLTAEQYNHWAVALRTAQAAPTVRLNIPALAAPAPAGGWRPPAHFEELQPADWPATVWHYPGHTPPVPERAASHMIVPLSVQDSLGTTGVRAIGLGPEAPWPQLTTMVGGPVRPPPGNPFLFEWVSINLQALSTRTNSMGQRAFRVFRQRDGDHVSYLIRPTIDHSDVGAIWFRREEFESQARLITPAEVRAMRLDAITPCEAPRARWRCNLL